MTSCEICESQDAPHRAPSFLTAQQQAENAAWAASFRGPNGETIWHTGHCPHLNLPGYLCTKHKDTAPEDIRRAIAHRTLMQLICAQEELRLTTEGKWIFEDPRHTIYKRCNIIILRPAGPAGIWDAGTGYVETHQGWSITTSFEDHRTIDKWDRAWCWSRSPGDRLGPKID
jgi:hypothetical protein